MKRLTDVEVHNILKSFLIITYFKIATSILCTLLLNDGLTNELPTTAYLATLKDVLSPFFLSLSDCSSLVTSDLVLGDWRWSAACVRRLTSS